MNLDPWRCPRCGEIHWQWFALLALFAFVVVAMVLK